MDLDAFLILNGGNIQIQERSGKLTISKHEEKERKEKRISLVGRSGSGWF